MILQNVNKLHAEDKSRLNERIPFNQTEHCIILNLESVCNDVDFYFF
jgi:hypothetical protein